MKTKAPVSLVVSPPSLGSGVGPEPSGEYDYSASLPNKMEVIKDIREDRRAGLPAKARKMQMWERWILTLALLCVVSIHWVYAQLEQSSADYIKERGLFDYESVEDWLVLHRAGIWSRQYNIRESAPPHPLAGQSPQVK